MNYIAESQALDREILGIINAWHSHGTELTQGEFNNLALRLFDYQLRYNAPYARYCERLGVTRANPPLSWDAIPAVPAPAFKEATLTTFDPAAAALVFETSGTTDGKPGRHCLETPALYAAALLAGFDRFMLADGAALRYFNCVPNPLESPHSSLGYMMKRVAEERGDGKTGWYLRDGELLFEALKNDLQVSVAEGQPVCLAATAFALVHVLDAMEREGLHLSLSPGSRVMETGGLKGRSRMVSREDLYERTCDRFGVNPETIVAEYGMTELSSQYYDRVSAGAVTGDRRKVGPPWLRVRVVGPDRKPVALGEIGSVLHVDLANRSSCIAIQTEDLGVRHDDGLVLLGRAADAEPRGCALDSEDLQQRRSASVGL
ncbi:MAG TPA: hypothetical protein VKR56_09545 [Candidatus Cybelea sp.]|nr:hypothetical protein [Candidatus Cybelea sp.]